MIKKSELRSVFERIVTSKKSLPIYGNILGWSIEIVDQPFNLPFIALFARVEHRSVCVERSYPFRSYRSAYQTLVRL